MEGSNAFLPQESIINILKRLPVKSLIRFQCVCKNWKNLLKDPLFIVDHLHHSSQQLSFLYQSNNQLYLRSFHCDFRQREVHNPPVIDYCLSSFSTRSDVRIIGSSNGLLCVELCGYYRSYYCLVLWNPAIKEVRVVPRRTIASERPFLIGFGFSSIANDYKIIKIRSSYWNYTLGVNGVLVYTLSTGLWKEVEFENIKHLSTYSEVATANNGAIIWLANNLNDDDGMLVSFDMAMKVFTLIPMPALPPWSTSIPTFYENKPAILSYNKEIGTSKSGFIHLWVVEEDTCASGGGKWTWNKIYSGNRYLHPYYLTPLNIWRNEIVCTVGFLSELVWRTEKYGEAWEDEGRTSCLLNPTTNEFKKFVMNNYSSGFRILDYVESLVSVGNIDVEEP
ncbi:putative F-box protein At3g16210 [Neltuma alba]|uniref:putative F-box protein At3g16210 n=1 Tax=Neltuma alba TaxID=207710 RepID=UPI0010A4EA96|nr:putative F-box protein At3g16210 [Prosopis alba]